MKRVEIWDGWRGLAILFVLIGHFYNIEWLWEDRLGVDIFFVLSGMLMSHILFKERMNLKKFYIRRFSRIIPVFFLYVAAIYTVAWLASLDFSTTEVLSTLVFLRTYIPIDPHIFDTKIAIGHLWSLNVEEHAYVMMSVLTLLIGCLLRAGLALTGLGFLSIGISWYYFSSDSIQIQYFYIRTECAVSFVFLSAGYSLLKEQYGFTAPGWLPLLSFFIAIACYLNDSPDWMVFSIAPIMLAVTVNHLSDAISPMKAILGWQPLRMLGIYSYSIYLWQQPFYLYSKILPGEKLTGLILALIAGYLSFRVFENPVRSYINNKWT